MKAPRDDYTKIDISKKLQKEMMIISVTEGKYLFRLADEIFRLGLEEYKKSKSYDLTIH